MSRFIPGNAQYLEPSSTSRRQSANEARLGLKLYALPEAVERRRDPYGPVSRR